MAMCSSDSDSSDWEEAPEQCEPCLCLFCSEQLELGGGEAVLEHCIQQHSFNLLGFIKNLGLDFYSCVKLINYIRKEHPEPLSLLALKSPPFPWLPDTYLTPVIENDPLLQLDFDPDDNDDETPPTETPPTVGSRQQSEEGADDGTDVHTKLVLAEKKLVEYEEALAQTLKDLATMRSTVQSLFSDDRSVKDEVKEGVLVEDSYFSSYTHYSIHETMLKDEARTEVYKLFIEKNGDLFRDKVVLDVGCGTGVLSMFAAKAGAKRVYGVDQSNIVYKAMDIVRENELENCVTLIKGRIEDVKLPEKVDIIISEWMGYFLLFESMLDSVLFARDKLLKNPANVFPNSCSMTLVAMGNKFVFDSKVKFWDNVYGLKMSCMRDDVLKEASVQAVDPYSLISSSDTVKKFDLTKVKVNDLDFEAPFSLTMQHDTDCHAIVGYFDFGFDHVTYPFYLSTGPQEVVTHWKQTVFFLKRPIPVHTGDLLLGKIVCRKHPKDPRALAVTLSLELSSFHPQAEHIKLEQDYEL